MSALLALRKSAARAYATLWRARRNLAMPGHLRRLRREIEAIRVWDAPASGPEELTVVGPVYNGEAHVESYVEHHLALGAAHVVLLDNGSTDRTVEIARGLARVTTLRSSLPFARYSLAMRRYLTGEFGRGGWVLLADIDERFDFPLAERLTLRGLLRYLNQADFTVMAAQMLDLFPDGPMSGWPLPGRDAVAAAVWCDVESLDRSDLPRAARRNEFPAGEPLYLRGGARRRTLGGNAILTKFPLLSRVAGGGPRVESAHFVSGGRVADVSGVLRHYKFDAGFREHCAEVLAHGGIPESAGDYRSYLRALDSNPHLVVRGAGARRYASAEDLAETGVVRVPERYRAFVETWNGGGSEAEPGRKPGGSLR